MENLQYLWSEAVVLGSGNTTADEDRLAIITQLATDEIAGWNVGDETEAGGDFLFTSFFLQFVDSQPATVDDGEGGTMPNPIKVDYIGSINSALGTSFADWQAWVDAQWPAGDSGDIQAIEAETSVGLEIGESDYRYLKNDYSWNNNTLNFVPDLEYTLRPGERYIIELVLFGQYNATPDCRCRVTVENGAEGRFVLSAIEPATESGGAIGATSGTIALTSSSLDSLRLSSSVFVDADQGHSGGKFRFEIAHKSSTSSTLSQTIFKGSYLKITRIRN